MAKTKQNKNPQSEHHNTINKILTNTTTGQLTSKLQLEQNLEVVYPLDSYIYMNKYININQYINI